MINESLKSSIEVKSKTECYLCSRNLCTKHQNDDRNKKKVANNTDLHEELKAKRKKLMKDCESDIINHSSKYVSDITEVLGC